MKDPMTFCRPCRRRRRLFVAGWSVFVLAALATIAAAVAPDYLPNSLKDQVRRPTTYVDARVLSADTAETVTVPTFESGSTQVRVVAIFSATCTDYYVRVGGTAAAPSSDVSDGSASERNPAALSFAQADTFSIVSSASCKVTLSYYRALAN